MEIKHQPYREIDPTATGSIGIQSYWRVRFNSELQEYEWVNEIVDTNEMSVEEMTAQVEWIMLPVKEKIKRLNQQLQGFQKELRDLKNKIITDYQQAWIYEMQREGVLTQQLVVEKQLLHYEFELSPSGTQNALDFARAKEVLISDFIQFNRALKAKCLFHDDKSPSMSYHKKRNRVHCFSCGVDKDVIDVIQVLQNCSVAEAVRFLCHT